MQQVSDLRAQTEMAVNGEIVEGLFAPTAYQDTLTHVDAIGGKAWRGNIATRVHNDALRYARMTWLKQDDAAQDSLVDWLVQFADTVYAEHLQTLNQWDADAVSAVTAKLVPNSAKAERVAWLNAFLETVQAESSMSKKQMTALQAAVATGAEKVAAQHRLAGQHIGGKRARKLLAHFKH
ncbi:hypothetical protein [Lacticaseibacillus sp. GG6-2]